jgi:hypothetical protein
MKLVALQAAEGAMWHTIMDVSSGVDASVALAKFIAEYDTMNKSWEDRADFAHDRKWFQHIHKYK